MMMLQLQLLFPVTLLPVFSIHAYISLGCLTVTLLLVDITLSPVLCPRNFGDGHLLKLYSPKLIAGVIFEVYDQHTQIITELDIKLNKWHITIEKLYRKPTETEQNF